MKPNRGTYVSALAAALMLVALASTQLGTAQAMQLIPSVGLAKSTDDNAADAQGYGGLALRASLLPFLKIEGGINYRQDTFSDGDLKVRQWPVTTSAWITPLPFLYAGGGVGWYRTTYDYKGTLPFEDTTTNKVGVHFGGGLALPVAPHLGLDLNGRYIFMQKDNNVQIPAKFNPDFWSTSLGVAISF